MRIKEGADLYPLIHHNYTKINNTYSKELELFEEGVVIQIILNPTNEEGIVIINTSIDGIEMNEERQEYFCEEYAVSLENILDEVGLLKNLGIIE